MGNQFDLTGAEGNQIQEDTLVLYVPEYCWNTEQIQKISSMLEREGFDNFNIQPRYMLDADNIEFASFGVFGLNSLDKEERNDEA